MELFDQACELPRHEAVRFLDALGPADADVKAALADMLEVDRRTQVFFDHTQGGAAALLAHDILDSALGGTARPRAAPAELPKSIGEYDILELVGAGGMGTVYRARQQHPERVVALKTLHPWLVSPAALERFRFEAQALATLKHPSIPPIFTVGQHEGTVYFAMELVNGPALTDWARARRPDVRERVARLVDICDAVHHAHLRGFVHRDLKPDNVRVGEDGVPRVLDFGIAAGLGERSVEVAGTPAYMSPEQVEPGATVDVRSDVFSLGVIAFELLAGQLPVVPPKSGLATLQALKKQPAPRLQTAAPSLGRDLDAIVARALAVDPSQRYASAAELADELRRFLAFFPVEARGGGALYRFARLVRRHRLAFGALTAVVVALLAGGVVSYLQYRQAQAARVVAEHARDQATGEAQRAKATLEFLRTVLAQADPEQGHARSRSVTIGDALDRAAEQLGKQQLDPRIASSVHASLAETYLGLYEYKPAEREANLALGAYDAAHLEDDELLAQTLILASRVRHENGLGDGALEAGARAIAVEQHLHGDVPHTHVSTAMHVQAVGLREAGRVAEAVALHARGVEIERALAHTSGDTQELADALNQYAVTLVLLGRYDEAETNYREALKLDLAQFGPRHPEVATDYHHLAWLAFQQDQVPQAKALLDQALDIRLATLGPDHGRVGVQRSLEALVQLALGDVKAADWAMDDCLRIARKSFGPEHAQYQRMEQERVPIRLAQGRVDEALVLGERVWRFTAQRYGPTHWVTMGARSDLAMAQLAAGQREAAITGLTEALGVFSSQFGERCKATRDARKRLAQAQAASSK
jgi:tetratricopeptide (TPR) repeat protein